MKEKYTKPMLELVAFELNENIASCTEKIHNNWHHGDCQETGLGAALEASGVTFTKDKEDCANGTELVAYCYYTSQDDGKVLLFNS